jgi:hypothetical protein
MSAEKQDQTRVWTPPTAPAAPPPEAPAAVRPLDATTLDRKLRLVRRLLGGSFVLNGAVLILLVQQSGELARNRQMIADMNQRAEAAIARLAPDLEARFKRLDAALVSFGAEGEKLAQRIRQSEDEFMRRLEREFPQIADRYFNQKMRSLRDVIR